MNHHPDLPPSSNPGLMQCPCFASNPDKSDDNTKGTQGHDYTAALIESRPVPECPDLDRSDHEDCEWAAEQVKSWAMSHFPFDVTKAEQTLSLVDNEGKEINYGTCDGTVGLGLWELKMCFDFRPEEHYYKPQTANYALALMRQKGVLERLKEDNAQGIKVLEVYIKPRKWLEYTISYAESVAMVEAVLEIKRKGGKPQPCDYCRFCSKLITCEAINQMHRSVVSRYSVTEGDLKAIQDPESIQDPALMSKAKTIAKLIDDWTERVGKAALELSANKEIPYYIRRERSGRRQVTDLKKAFLILNKQWPALTDQSFLECCSFSFSDASNTIAKLQEMAIKRADKEIKDLLADITEHGEPTFYLQAQKTEKKKVEEF